MQKFILDGKNLTISDVYKISKASGKEIQLELSPDCLKRVQRSRQMVMDVIKNKKVVYGINTGFGALASKHIPDEDLTQLQYNLIRSHCAGVGKPYSRELTRAIMLLRAHCLAIGHSGVSPEIIHLILEFLNKDINPLIPEKGSVGASGDLAPLAHLALCLIGEGEVKLENKFIPTSFALFQLGLKPVELGPKDGLALINGTAVMTALAAIAIQEAHTLMKTADIASAL